MFPCEQQDSDSRLLLHTIDYARNDHEKIMIRTVNTDVVVLAKATSHHLVIHKL